MSYLEATKDFYRDAAITPDEGLCCTTSPVWALPELAVPPRMLEMNYGCGSTVHPRDLTSSPSVVYVGIGGGLELLQFAYFARRPGAVINIEPVAEMREAARANLAEAARRNAWFRADFVDIREGDALSLPLDDSTADDGACVSTGRSAIYYGREAAFDDGKGHLLSRDAPLAVCDKTAKALETRGIADLMVTGSTWFYDGGGCC